MTRLSVATFNMHGGRSLNGKPLGLEGILRSLNADVVALQEVVQPRGGESEAEIAAAELGYRVFQTTFESRGRGPAEPVGIALLSRLPVADARLLPLGRTFGDGLKRSAIGIRLELGASDVSVFATHLSHRLYGSIRQLRKLAVIAARRPADTMIVGDLNCFGPLAAAISGMRRGVIGRTWPASAPLAQIDHVLASPRIRKVSGSIGKNVGSDHRPVSAVFDLPER